MAEMGQAGFRDTVTRGRTIGVHKAASPLPGKQRASLSHPTASGWSSRNQGPSRLAQRTLWGIRDAQCSVNRCGSLGSEADIPSQPLPCPTPSAHPPPLRSTQVPEHAQDHIPVQGPLRGHWDTAVDTGACMSKGQHRVGNTLHAASWGVLGAVRWDFKSFEGPGAPLVGRERASRRGAVSCGAGPHLSGPQACPCHEDTGLGVGVGLGPWAWAGEGAGGTGPPGAALIWGLALTSKLAAWLECPAVAGAEGRCLVPIKLQRVTVASWGLWR